MSTRTFLKLRSKASRAPRGAHCAAMRKSLRASPVRPLYFLFLTELSAVVKCSTVMVTTTVCSRTASSSRTPSFGPEPVITTDPPSGTRPATSRSQTSRTRTMAERLDSLTFTLPRRRRRRRRGRPGEQELFPSMNFSWRHYCFISALEKHR